ncbi:MAG: hypothetical protein FJY92_05930, partial [Candidatus Hydrogenedentes bacterium]|nr:hypothetical protein [Candidatus Hydrogenedentota bacterium]
MANREIDDGRNRGRRRLIAVVIGVPAVAIVIVVCMVVAWVLRTTGGVERRLEEIRAKGEPVTLAELERWYPPVPDEENAALPLEKAFETLHLPRDPNAPVPLFNNVDGYPKWPVRGQPLPKEVRAAIDTMIDENAECLAHIAEAAQFERCRFANSPLDDSESERDHVDALRALGGLLVLQTLARADSGDIDGALASVGVGLALSEFLRGEALPISQFVRMAMAFNALRALQHALSCGPASKEVLESLAMRLGTCLDDAVLSKVLIGARCEFVADMSARIGHGPFALFTAMDTTAGVDALGEMIVAASRPPLERHALFQDIRARRFPEELSLVAAVTQMQTSVELYLYTRADEVQDKHFVLIQIASVVLRIEIARVMGTAVPSAVEALVPQYIHAIPIDPFDGKPMKYRRNDRGYVVYSIGADRMDGGGRDPEELPTKQSSTS